MNSEPGVTTKTRADVLARDDYTCWYCPKSADTVDHVIPRTRGGSHDGGNLVAACQEHNHGLGATPPTLELIQAVKEKQRQWDGERFQRATVVMNVFTTVWPAHQWPKKLRNEINEWLYWMPIAVFLKEIKETPLDDPSSPAWPHLRGRLSAIRHTLLDRHDWSTNGAQIQRWNDPVEITRREKEQILQTLARLTEAVDKLDRVDTLAEKIYQMERYLLAEDD